MRARLYVDETEPSEVVHTIVSDVTEGGRRFEESRAVSRGERRLSRADIVFDLVSRLEEAVDEHIEITAIRYFEKCRACGRKTIRDGEPCDHGARDAVLRRGRKGGL